MPFRDVGLVRVVPFAVTSVASTRIVPYWTGSSPFRHVIRVDFPEPEGPQTTTTSPVSTFVVQSLST